MFFAQSEQRNHTLPAQRLCHKSVHGSTGSPRTDHSAFRINYLAVRPEPFDSPFVLSLSKDERFAQDRRVEGRAADCDTVSHKAGFVGYLPVDKFLWSSTWRAFYAVISGRGNKHWKYGYYITTATLYPIPLLTLRLRSGQASPLKGEGLEKLP